MLNLQHHDRQQPADDADLAVVTKRPASDAPAPARRCHCVRGPPLTCAGGGEHLGVLGQLAKGPFTEESKQYDRLSRSLNVLDRYRSIERIALRQKWSTNKSEKLFKAS